LTYDRIVAELFQKQTSGFKFNLEPVRAFLERLDNPHIRFRSVHIAGTNGKGSTSAMIESVLQCAGYRTGLYTSPHLVDMRERIQVLGRPISKRLIMEFMKTNREAIEATGVSFFEILTALAFQHFKREGVDIAVVETGLGGRLDATNVLSPEVTVITDIGLEHTQWLGNTLESILMEKAGILKPGIPCVSGVAMPRLRRRLEKACLSRGASLTPTRESTRVSGVELDETESRFNLQTPAGSYPRLHVGLAGRHQIENASTAVLTLETLRGRGWKIPNSAIEKGLAEVRWPGRLDLVRRSPKILLDSAHNPHGGRRLAQALGEIFHHDRLILVFGVMKDKNYGKMADILFPLADRLILTRPDNPRALDPRDLARSAGCRNPSVVVLPDSGEALEHAVHSAGLGDLICVTGSIFLVGEALGHLKKSSTADRS
jgi:dihydrofolate synthase/folylpolyglutamate synthase